MSKTIDYSLRDRVTESLALEMDITFDQAKKILEIMDEEVKAD